MGEFWCLSNIWLQNSIAFTADSKLTILHLQLHFHTDRQSLLIGPGTPAADVDGFFFLVVFSISNAAGEHNESCDNAQSWCRFMLSVHYSPPYKLPCGNSLEIITDVSVILKQHVCS